MLTCMPMLQSLLLCSNRISPSSSWLLFPFSVQFYSYPPAPRGTKGGGGGQYVVPLLVSYVYCENAWSWQQDQCVCTYILYSGLSKVYTYIPTIRQINWILALIWMQIRLGFLVNKLPISLTFRTVPALLNCYTSELDRVSVPCLVWD